MKSCVRVDSQPGAKRPKDSYGEGVSSSNNCGEILRCAQNLEVILS